MRFDHSFFFSKFVSVACRRGLKNRAHTLVKKACLLLQFKFKLLPLEVLEKAVKNARPLLSVRGKRFAGTIRSLPCYLPVRSSNSLAIRWIIEGAKSRTESSSFDVRLASELVEAFNNKGYAIKKREALHQLAASNRAFVNKTRVRSKPVFGASSSPSQQSGLSSEKLLPTGSTKTQEPKV